MILSEALLDILEAIDIRPEDLPKIPEVKVPQLPHVEIGVNNKNVLIILSAGLVGFTIYLIAKYGSNKEEKKPEEDRTE